MTITDPIINVSLLIIIAMYMYSTCIIDVLLSLVMQLFRKSRSHKSPVVMAAVTMPCLKILHSLINPRVSTSKSDIVRKY